MKIEFTEHDGCFGIDLTAENLEDAAKLVRFGMDRTKAKYVVTDIFKEGRFAASIVFGKHKRSNSTITKRK